MVVFSAAAAAYLCLAMKAVPSNMPHLTDEQPTNLAQAQGVLAEVYTYVGGAGWYREGSSPYAYQEASERQAQIQSNQEWIAAIFEENPEFDIGRWSVNATPVQDLFESIPGEVLGYSSPIDSASRLNVWSDYAEQGLELLGDPLRGGGAVENLSSVFSWSSFSPGYPGTATRFRDATSWSAWLGPAGLFRDHRGHWLVCYIIGVKDEGSAGTLTADEIYTYGESGRPCAIFYNITRQKFEEKYIKFPSLHGAENRRGGGWLTMQVPAGPGGRLVTDKVVNVMTDYRPPPMRVSMPSPDVAMTFARPFAFTEGQGYPPGELWEWEGEVGQEYSTVPIAGIDVFGNSGARIARHEIRGAILQGSVGQSPSWCMSGTDVFWTCEARPRKDSQVIVHNVEYWASRAQWELVQWKVGTYQNTDRDAIFYSDPAHTGVGFDSSHHAFDPDTDTVMLNTPEYRHVWSDTAGGWVWVDESEHRYAHQLENMHLPGEDVYWSALVYAEGQFGDVTDFPWREYYAAETGWEAWHPGLWEGSLNNWYRQARIFMYGDGTLLGEQNTPEGIAAEEAWLAQQQTEAGGILPRITTVNRGGFQFGEWNDPAGVIQPIPDESIPPFVAMDTKSKTEFPFEAHVQNNWVRYTDATVGFVCHNGDVLGALPSLEVSVDIELTTWTPTNPGNLTQAEDEGYGGDSPRWLDDEEIKYGAWTEAEYKRGDRGPWFSPEAAYGIDYSDVPRLARGLTEETRQLEGKAMFQPRGVMGYSSKLGGPVFVGRFTDRPLINFGRETGGWRSGGAADDPQRPVGVFGGGAYGGDYLQHLLHSTHSQTWTSGFYPDYYQGETFIKDTNYQDPTQEKWVWIDKSDKSLAFLQEHREDKTEELVVSPVYYSFVAVQAAQSQYEDNGAIYGPSHIVGEEGVYRVVVTQGLPSLKYENLGAGLTGEEGDRVWLTYVGFYHARTTFRSPMVYGGTTTNTLQSEPEEYEPDLSTPVTGGMGGATPEAHRPDPKNTALHHGYIWGLSGGEADDFGAAAGGPWALQDSFVFHTTRQVAGNKYNPIYDKTPDPDSYPVHICEGPDKCMYIHMSNMYVWRWDPTGGAGNCEPTKTGLYISGDVPLSSDPAWAAGHEAGDKWVERGKLLAAGISIPANPGVGDEAEVEDFQAGFGDTGPGQHGAGLPGDYNNDGVIDAADYTMIVDATPGIGD